MTAQPTNTPAVEATTLTHTLSSSSSERNLPPPKRVKKTKTKPADDKLHEAYDLFGFEASPQRQTAFTRLVEKWIVCNAPEATSFASLEPGQRIDIVRAFLQTYGRRLWPGSKAERQHLSRPGLWKKGPFKRSPIFEFDIRASKTMQKAYAAHHGEMDRYTSAAYSVVGDALKKYFESVWTPTFVKDDMLKQMDDDYLVKEILRTDFVSLPV